MVGASELARVIDQLIEARVAEVLGPVTDALAARGIEFELPPPPTVASQEFRDVLETLLVRLTGVR